MDGGARNLDSVGPAGGGSGRRPLDAFADATVSYRLSVELLVLLADRGWVIGSLQRGDATTSRRVMGVLIRLLPGMVSEHADLITPLFDRLTVKDRERLLAEQSMWSASAMSSVLREGGQS